MKLPRILSALFASLLLAVFAAAGDNSGAEWLADVSPLLLRGEESAYRNLQTDAEREEFQRQFWESRSISREEYYRRLAYIDHEFGTGKRGSGWNTDQGRVYLTLGEPHQLVRLPESRIFYPMEIWRYRAAPEAGINVQMDLLFYRRRDAGLPRLYSPTLDTVRALLRPNPSTRGMFPVNDIVTPNDLLDRLNVPPAEVDFAEAAFSIAKGVKGLGNDELLAVVTSPARALERKRKTDVQSRFLAAMPMHIRWNAVHTGQTGAAVDIAVECTAARMLRLEVLEGEKPLGSWQTNLSLAQTEDLLYLHRVFLLPGRYTLRAYADGLRTAAEIVIPDSPAQGSLLAGEADLSWNGAASPFQYGRMRLIPSVTPRVLAAGIPEGTSGAVVWRLRQGSRNVASGKISAGEMQADPDAARGLLRVELPPLEPGAYIAEIQGDTFSRSASVTVAAEPEPRRSQVVYSANLGRGAEWLAWGRQLAMRGQYSRAEEALARAAAEKHGDTETLTLLAKVKHLQGDQAAGNRLLEQVLQTDPGHVDALAAYGYSKASAGDPAAALVYLRRALSLRDDPIIAQAVAALEAPVTP